MGTSTSSVGPKSNVPFDPPWLDEAPPEKNVERDAEKDNTDPAAVTSQDANLPSAVAPPARFGSARRLLGKFAKGDRSYESFSKAIGHYSATGMGGASRIANRMVSSTSSGANLAQFLNDVKSRTDAVVDKWVDDILGQKLSSHEIIDAIIRHVSPESGTKDDESCKNSMAQAMSEFLDQHEDADLLSLQQDDVRLITELFIANEAYSRIMNDIGLIFESSTMSPKESMEICNQMHEYLVNDISVEMEKLWLTNVNPSKDAIDSILKTAIANTFAVYENGI